HVVLRDDFEPVDGLRGLRESAVMLAAQPEPEALHRGHRDLLQDGPAGGLAPVGRLLADPALALAAVLALAPAGGGGAVGRALAGVDARALDRAVLGGLGLRCDTRAHGEEGSGGGRDGDAGLDG